MMLEIRAGDFIGVQTGTPGGWFIRLKDWFYSTDSEATYSHLAIASDAFGHTTECRMSRGINRYHLADWYGKRIIVFRPNADMVHIYQGLAAGDSYIGRRYSWWRILLHAISRPLAKIGTGEWLVCSEHWAYVAWKMGLRHDGYMGVTPDMAIDEMRSGRNYTLVYEGLQTYWGGK